MAEEYLTDDEQWEAIKRGIAENGLWVVAGVALGVALFMTNVGRPGLRRPWPRRQAPQHGHRGPGGDAHVSPRPALNRPRHWLRWTRLNQFPESSFISASIP